MKKPLFMLYPTLAQGISTLVQEHNDLPEGLPYLAETLCRNVGIEIEVEDCGDYAYSTMEICEGWLVERDPSLRGDSAYEFKTKFPTTCSSGLRALKKFFSMVDELRKDYDNLFSFSERTSIHVHIDVRDLTINEVKSAVKLYAVFEKTLFDLVGRHRFHNVFCIPLTESNIISRYSPLGDDWYQNWDKYCAINLQPIPMFGTIEFRAMAGNDNVKLISSWLVMLSALVEYAAQNSPEVVDATLKTLKTESQYQQLADNIFGSAFARNLVMFPEASDAAASLIKLL